MTVTKCDRCGDICDFAVTCKIAVKLPDNQYDMELCPRCANSIADQLKTAPARARRDT